MCKNSYIPVIEKNSDSREIKSSVQFDGVFQSDYNKTKRTEIEKMSFIVAIMTPNGIVMCSDSKATRKELSGRSYEDIGREPIKKVFSNKKLILSTWGTNEIYTCNTIIKLEDVLKEIIKTAETEINLMSQISKIIGQSLLPNNADPEQSPYFFFVGCKCGKGYRLSEYRTTCYGSQITRSTNVPATWVGGVSGVCPEILQFNSNSSIEEAETFGKNLVQYVIDLNEPLLKNKLASYWSVGGEIQCETLS